MLIVVMFLLFFQSTCSSNTFRIVHSTTVMSQIFNCVFVLNSMKFEQVCLLCGNEIHHHGNFILVKPVFLFAMFWGKIDIFTDCTYVSDSCAGFTLIKIVKRNIAPLRT